MALGSKTGGRDIKPGQVLNPKGRPKIDPELKEARKLNKSDFERRINKYLHLPPNELKEIADNPNTEVIDIIICKILAKGVNTGNYKILDFILDRLIGKVKETLNLNGEITGGGAINLYIPDNKRGDSKND